MNEDSSGYVWAAIFWAVIIGVTAIRGLIRGRREAARRRRPPTRSSHVELEKLCPQCNKPLKGAPLAADDFVRDRPLHAWRVCFECGYEERAIVELPWTRAQGDAIRAETQRRKERQLIAEYEERQRLRTASTRQGWFESTPQQFEHSVAEILSVNGYTNVYVCGGAGDLSVDIQAVSPEGEPIAVQCKRYGDKPVGSKDLQTFIGMLHAHHHIECGIYVTTSRFTKAASALAEQHNIVLVDGQRLLDMARPLDPGDADDHEVIRSLAMWSVVQRERQEQASERERQAELERRRRARYWAHLKPR